MSKEQTELLADYFTEKPETTTTEILEILFMSNTHMIEENKKQPRTTESTVMQSSAQCAERLSNQNE
jgi:hypothetical protein